LLRVAFFVAIVSPWNYCSSSHKLLLAGFSQPHFSFFPLAGAGAAGFNYAAHLALIMRRV
jgi:hypothetical protein